MDALVLHHSSAHGREIWALVESLKVPTIVTRASEAVQGHTTVGYDDRKAFRRLTQHLIDLGHKRFGLMMIASPQVERRGTLDPDPRVGSAYAGVIEALHEVGLVIAPGHRTNTYFSIGKGRANFRKIMSTQPRPTALVCMNDQLAVGALFEAAAMGLRVPQDVSVVGFDDMELSALVTPPLTTHAHARLGDGRGHRRMRGGHPQFPRPAGLPPGTEPRVCPAQQHRAATERIRRSLATYRQARAWNNIGDEQTMCCENRTNLAVKTQSASFQFGLVQG